MGETRDDAAGEAFDKVARLLGLPYPGGPEIQKLAARGNCDAITFPQPMRDQKNYDFSFSGLKTAVLYYLRDNLGKKSKSSPSGYTSSSLKTHQTFVPSPQSRGSLNDLVPARHSLSKGGASGVKPRGGHATLRGSQLADVAASFEKAVTDVLVYKTQRAAREYMAKTIILCGGVAANRELRDSLALSAKRLAISFFVPDFEFNTDNAAMIAAAAYIRKLSKKRKYRLVADSNLNL